MFEIAIKTKQKIVSKFIIDRVKNYLSVLN